ncbi:MAG: hypothetical protein V3S37_06030 [Dehalococcoidia bacterium]
MSEAPPNSDRNGGEAEYDLEKQFGYKRAVAAVYLLMMIAVAVTLFSLYVALTGTGGFPGK